MDPLAMDKDASKKVCELIYASRKFAWKPMQLRSNRNGRCASEASACLSLFETGAASWST